MNVYNFLLLNKINNYNLLILINKIYYILDN